MTHNHSRLGLTKFVQSFLNCLYPISQRLIQNSFNSVFTMSLSLSCNVFRWANSLRSSLLSSSGFRNHIRKHFSFYPPDKSSRLISDKVIIEPTIVLRIKLDREVEIFTVLNKKKRDVKKRDFRRELNILKIISGFQRAGLKHLKRFNCRCFRFCSRAL